MKIIKNIEIGHSLNKGLVENMYENTDELKLFYPILSTSTLSGLSKQLDLPDVIGVVKRFDYKPSKAEFTVVKIGVDKYEIIG